MTQKDIHHNHDLLKAVCLLTAQLLLGIIAVVHVLVMSCYLLRMPVSAYVFPAAVMMVPGLAVVFFGNKKVLLVAFVVTMAVLGVALCLGWFYFDLSWDGQWYQQAAVYDLGGAWNPLFRPLDTPDHANHTSILHFPKSTWYFGAALLRLSGNVEVGKAYNMIVLFAAFGVVYAFCRELALSFSKSLIFSLLVVLNPVVWSELFTYLNDGDLYLLLVTYLAATILWLCDRRRDYFMIALLAVCCLVNTKFTGLVFFLVTAFFILLYVLIRQSKRIVSFVLMHAGMGLAAIVIMGFNPYLTNMINRGHPLYPLMGTKAYPSVFAGGGDDNEAYETPQNMQGKSLPVRLFYANFGQPGNAPYNGEKGARLVNPFNSDFKSWSAYRYHETRVSGFGPYFGILLLLSLFGFVWADKKYFFPIFVWLAGLICCLSLSKHFWWPRFFPMLWLFPLLTLLMLWLAQPSQLKRGYGYLLVLLIALNGLIVAVVHMQWETTTSIALRKELQCIHRSGKPILIDYGWFKRSMEEKLHHWQIRFTPGGLKGPDRLRHPLPSVVEGYPNQVMYEYKTN